MAKHKVVIYFLLLASFLIMIQPMAYSQSQSFSIKSYRIQTIPFERYETTSGGLNKTAIVFAEYGKEAKVIYPAPKDMIPDDSSFITKKCYESLAKNIDEIVKVQTQNRAINDYLSLNNKISPLSKEGYLNILKDPQEETVQKDSNASKIIAEFRSKEFTIGEKARSCIYLTFIYDSQSKSIEKIILSAVKLESDE